MPLLEVLDRLRHRAARRNESAAETLWANAKRTAAGESADDDAVEAALAETNASVDDFAGLVELARRRRAWFAKADKGTAANARLAKATAVAERERGEFERVAAAWRARAVELDAEIAAAQRDADAASDAVEQLVAPDNCAEPHRTALVEAEAARIEAAERVSALEREIRAAKERHRHHTDWAEQHRKFNSSGPGGNADDHERFAARATKRLAELEPELHDAQAAFNAAVDHKKACQAAALKQ